MNPFIDDNDCFWSMVDAVCAGTASDEEIRTLESRLRTDENARSLYIAYCQLDAALELELGGQRAGMLACEAIRSEMPTATADDFSGMAIASCPSAPVAPVSDCFGAPLRNPVGCFSAGWPLAYLVATLIFGIGGLIGSFAYVSRHEEIADSSLPMVADRRLDHLSKVEGVGQLTSMVDCKWADQSDPLLPNHLLRLGHKLNLESGLLEIRYHTGANVILQGPVTYVLESRNGGFMSVGKLTGKVTTPNAKGFSVRTPTATVTDLGTEFGVEVDMQKSTRVSVLEGQVELRSSVGPTRITRLEKGQSSLVDAHGLIVQQSQAEVAAFAKTFVRSMPRRRMPDFVSLTDLVASGDGFGDRSFWGISPADASMIAEPPTDVTLFESTGKYQRYTGLPQIDGVFIPDGSDGPVQIDSEGHTFALPKTCGQSCEWGAWAYKGQAWQEPFRKRAESNREDASSSMLLLHANAGITFNLAEIRATARGQTATRFQAVIQNCQWNMLASRACTADVWIFVDGRLCFSRMKFRKTDGSMDVDIPLGPNDRFLTLVSTDGGDGISFDNPCFLNPRISLETLSPEGGALQPQIK